MNKSSIEWCTHTLALTRGCERYSPGCEKCYAERIAGRFCEPTAKMPRATFAGFATRGKSGARWTGVVLALPDNLQELLTAKDPRTIFICSTSDLFHKDVPDEYIAAVFGAMAATQHHTYKILTKRAARLPQWFIWASMMHGGPLHGSLIEADAILGKERASRAFNPDTRWPLPNVHIGVSVENQKYADERVPLLLQTPAAVRWLSCEPLLGPIVLREWIEPLDHCSRCLAIMPPQADDKCGECSADWTLVRTYGHAQSENYTLGERYRYGSAEVEDGPQLHSVVAGAESGPGARPMADDWVRSLRDECSAAGVPLFYKQNAVKGRKSSLPILDGVQHLELP